MQGKTPRNEDFIEVKAEDDDNKRKSGSAIIVLSRNYLVKTNVAEQPKVVSPRDFYLSEVKELSGEMQLAPSDERESTTKMRTRKEIRKRSLLSKIPMPARIT